MKCFIRLRGSYGDIGWVFFPHKISLYIHNIKVYIRAFYVTIDIIGCHIQHNLLMERKRKPPTIISGCVIGAPDYKKTLRHSVNNTTSTKDKGQKYSRLKIDLSA